MDLPKLTTRKGKSRLKLGCILDIRAAEPLKGVLQKARDKGHPLIIEAGSVERLTTPCIQVLLAAAEALKEAGISFTLSKPSEAFVDSFNELGLFPALKQWNIEA